MRSRAVALEQARDGVAAERRQENTERASDVPLRLLRFGEVRRRTGLSRSTIWRMERSGMFPKRVKVSVNVVAWREDEVGEWIRSKCS
jgi:prophage regulatory protein